MKIKCNKCGRELELNNQNFYFTDTTAQGYKTPCKECMKKDRRERYWKNREKEISYYYKNKERLREAQREYYYRNAEKIRAQQRARNRAKRKAEKLAKKEKGE